MNDRLEAAIAELVAALKESIPAKAPEEEPERLLSIDEVARRLSIGRTTVYAELAAGRLRSVKVGRRRLVPATALRELVDR